MKNMTRSILLAWTVFAACAIYGGQSPGVAGVDVVVKQNPSKHATTDARGNFAFEALPPGSYTLAFRSRKSKDTPAVTTSKVTVASTYSIKIEGTKRAVNQSGLTSDKLLAGVNVAVEVGAGAKVRGQVLAGETKKMVWIAQEPGSHIPGHWAEAGSKEAASHNSQVLSGDEMRDTMNRNNANMTEGPSGAPR
jgi:Carboxypeptidase regulatory-like domain